MNIYNNLHDIKLHVSYGQGTNVVKWGEERLEQKKRGRAVMYIEGRFDLRNNKVFTHDKFVRRRKRRQNL